MDESSSELSEKILSIIKENKVVTGLILLSVVLLVIGLNQLRHSSQDNEILITEDTAQAEVKGEAVTKEKIMVDIAGAVRNPGVYELPADSRIKDVIVTAGGFSDNVASDLVAKSINLAQKVIDGEKIYIPLVGETVTVNSASTYGGKVSINSASVQELDSLPGVGAVTSQKIIEGRPYSSIDDLVTKKAVTKAVFEKIKEKIHL